MLFIVGSSRRLVNHLVRRAIALRLSRQPLSREGPGEAAPEKQDWAVALRLSGLGAARALPSPRSVPVAESSFLTLCLCICLPGWSVA